MKWPPNSFVLDAKHASVHIDLCPGRFGESVIAICSDLRLMEFTRWQAVYSYGGSFYCISVQS
uniref:Uncharacterized protein n=1 Tax=Arundo donax TaxID=35708 RepID=A0A0A9GQ83_ARUDO